MEFDFSTFLSKSFLLAVLLLISSIPACSKRDSTPHQADVTPVTATKAVSWFEEVAVQARVDFHHTSGASGRFYNPEIVCGGVGLLDYDGDGNLDIYCVQGGSLDPGAVNPPANKLFRNLGHWQFNDVTESAGVGGKGYGMGCACADYDGDGNVDIYVTNVGPNMLYRNNGDGTFSNVTAESRVAGNAWSSSAAFFDYDGDGNLDLIVANYMNWAPDREIECYSRGGKRDYCSPKNYLAPAMANLYHNKGDGTFDDVTLSAGLDKTFGNGLGVVCADFDHDGKPDIFVANDAMPNQLWMNQGNGRFVDEAMIRGCAVNLLGMTEAGMGIAAVDIYQRGWLDLFVTHLVGEGNRLWVNTNGYFMDTITPKGPGTTSLPFTGFGVAFADFDNDGNLDLYVANGKVKFGQRQFDPNDPYAEPNSLFRGLGGDAFEEVVPQRGIVQPLIATSRGLAVGDLDNDGSLDIVVINKDGPLHLLRNIVGSRGNWIMLRLLNTKGLDAIGTIIQLETKTKTYWRYLIPNQGYCSSNDPRIHCGLGTETRVQRVTVRWPNNKVESFGPFDAGRIYAIREGSERK